MRILYDFRIFSLQDYGGISKYFIKVSEQLSINNSVKIISPFYINKYLKDLKNNNFIKYFYLKKKYKYTTKVIYFINSLFTQIYIFFYKPEIVHLTYYPETYYKKKNRNYKLVVTVYDLIHELYSSKYNYNKQINIKKNIIYAADHIICISKNTKKDLINYYNISEKNISVIYLGYDKKIEIDPIADINNEKPFFLYVGSRDKYKNFLKFIEAFSLSDLLKKNFNIYFFGSCNFTSLEINYITKLGINLDQIKHFSGDDKKLNYLYSKAYAFVFPSFYEGFGIPLLESMHIGCPIVCSNTSSFLEIANDAALFFDPHNTEDIKNKLEKIFNDKNLRKKLIDYGYENLKKFGWDICSQETLSLYKNLKKLDTKL